MAEAWIANNTPSADRHYFGNHMMFRERPEAFNAVLDAFLEALGPQ